jgi:rubrerythrin
MNTPIPELMQCGKKERGTLKWLRNALQSAITLEFATLPPYLTALWSIKEEMHPVAVSIREVVQEEMQHMGYACNMLKAIGGMPRIAGCVPQYPTTGLPGGVMPDLVVDIDGLSLESLRTFMTIEQPEIDILEPPEIDVPTDERPKAAQTGEFATIGDFYDAIAAAFKQIKPALVVEGQVIGPRTGWAMDSLKAVLHAIETIKEQGEGSSGTPVDYGPADWSHYYRFAEIEKGRKIVAVPGETNKWMYSDQEMPFPAVWPTVKLPRGGYDRDRVTGAVEHLLDAFDKAFTAMVDELQAAWTHGDQAALLRAIEAMFGMQEYALALMKIPRYDGKGNYVPRWRYLANEADF